MSKVGFGHTAEIEDKLEQFLPLGPLMIKVLVEPGDDNIDVKENSGDVIKHSMSFSKKFKGENCFQKHLL